MVMLLYEFQIVDYTGLEMSVLGNRRFWSIILLVVDYNRLAHGSHDRFLSNIGHQASSCTL